MLYYLLSGAESMCHQVGRLDHQFPHSHIEIVLATGVNPGNSPQLGVVIQGRQHSVTQGQHFTIVVLSLRQTLPQGRPVVGVKYNRATFTTQSLQRIQEVFQPRAAHGESDAGEIEVSKPLQVHGKVKQFPGRTVLTPVTEVAFSLGVIAYKIQPGLPAGQAPNPAAVNALLGQPGHDGIRERVVPKAGQVLHRQARARQVNGGIEAVPGKTLAIQVRAALRRQFGHDFTSATNFYGCGQC